MHAATWYFPGDPDALLARYDALVAEVPAESLRFHACLRAAEGILVVDTCPTRAAFEEFRDAGWFAEALARHRMPRPELHDYPVHAAFVRGERADP